jgi:phosphatidate phosphatase APP1
MHESRSPAAGPDFPAAAEAAAAEAAAAEAAAAEAAAAEAAAAEAAAAEAAAAEAAADIAADIAAPDIAAADVRATDLADVNVVVFRGYGTSHRLFFSGRVLRNAPDVAVVGASVLHNLTAAFNRLDSNELPNVRVRAEHRGESWEAITDEEGYFLFEIEPQTPLASALWHDVTVAPVDPATDSRGAAVTAQVLTPLPAATFGVISDVDDTILRSYITSVFKMALEMLLKNAYTRATFPGVPAFYAALHAGRTGRDSNPIFYVSLSPWNFYSLLTQFLEINGIPQGPLLLRDYGLQLLRSFGRPSPKRKLIQELLDLYPALPFLLLGDSGQHDPEIYAEVVAENPGRILAIYIRDVSDGEDAERAQSVGVLAEATRTHGVDMLLSSDTAVFAAHAAAAGWIQPRDSQSLEPAGQ